MKSTPCTGKKLKSSDIQYSFSKAPRCGSKTRAGTPCMCPAILNKHRCRMHGGKGDGAPRGNKNALKHGHTTREAKDKLKEIKDMLRESRKFITQFKS